MLKEFRDFIMTGNVIDLAIAVLLAGAVGLVVKGFVGDIMMPFIGHFAGGANFEDLFYAMDGNNYLTLEEANAGGGAVIAWGRWVNAIINLVIVGFVLFMIVKIYAKVRKKKEEAPAPDPGPTELDLLKDIKELLKK